MRAGVFGKSGDEFDVGRSFDVLVRRLCPGVLDQIFTADYQIVGALYKTSRQTHRAIFKLGK